ncbi:MAG: acetylglutamate kinase [Candidatus Micrarchaeota archaeon]|nr:acetylglutamate kinase [Candidatus Micrarchaeota archaeon]
MVKGVPLSAKSEDELEFYLKQFKKIKPGKFALIKISGNTVEHRFSEIVKDLAFLSKVGLAPIVIHGGGKQIDIALEKMGIEIRKVNGMRITDEKTMEVVSAVLNSITSKLVKSINSKGGKAVNANGLRVVRVRKTGKLEGVDLGLVGDVDEVDRSRLEELCGSGRMPVLASIGYNGGVAYNINADTMASELVGILKPNKFILVTETGGVLDKNGALISTIHIRNDLPGLIKNGVIQGGMLLKVNELKELLQKCPNVTIEICSAKHLLKELFTIKGSGTLMINE